jgi:hypothetical protein
MKSAVVFTNKMSVDLMNWLKKHSAKTKKTKRSIIEAALEEYRIKHKKLEMAEGFKRAAKDPEIMAMAEEGFQDYNEQLKRFDI